MDAVAAMLAEDVVFWCPVAFKPYPCARQLHAGVEALLNLIKRHEFAATAISAIDLAVPPHRLGEPAGENSVTSRPLGAAYGDFSRGT